MHPFHERQGAEAVAEVFWAPLLRAVTHLQRRPDIVMAGLNEIDGEKTVWVASMGHLMGLFDRPGWASGPRGAWSCSAMPSSTGSRAGASRRRPSSSTSRTYGAGGQDPSRPATGAHLVQPGAAHA
jgi:hypothetical protein